MPPRLPFSIPMIILRHIHVLQCVGAVHHLDALKLHVSVHRHQDHLLRQFLKQYASSVFLNPMPLLRERVVIELIFIHDQPSKALR
jgi:hypothetical protein